MQSFIFLHIITNNFYGMGSCILIIDEDSVARELTCLVLSDVKGIDRVASFAYGRHAIEFIENFLPEYILVDINMPEVDGLEIIEILNNHPKRHRFQVVPISAYFRRDYKESLLKLGIKELIEKPITEAKIQNLMARLVDAD